MAKPNVFLIINHRQVLCLKIIWLILKTLMLIRENMQRKAGINYLRKFPIIKNSLHLSANLL